MERRGVNTLGGVAGSLAASLSTSDLDYVLANFAPKFVRYIESMGQNQDVAYLKGENEQLKRRCEEQSALIKSQQAIIDRLTKQLA